MGRLHPLCSPDEYAALFEEVYPVEADRRSYLDAKVAGAKPSYGHLSLATLMHAGQAPLVWTTNLGSLIVDACAKVYEVDGEKFENGVLTELPVSEETAVAA